VVFSQIRTEQAKDVINTAKMHGLEFHILREDADWTTFQFTTHFAKLSFDEMCRQTGVGIHGDYPTTQLTDALDAIAEGASPDKVLSILEGRSITRGMSNAYTHGGGFRYICASEGCGVSIPSYRGRYPASCPACGGGLMTAEQWERRRAKRESTKRRESVTERLPSQKFVYGDKVQTPVGPGVVNVTPRGNDMIQVKLKNGKVHSFYDYDLKV